MILKFKNVAGMLLTQEAHFKGLRYQVFWGTTSECYYARVFRGEDVIAQSVGRDPNFGHRDCLRYCEAHALKHAGLFDKIKAFFRR